ncbi:MAG TPA: hypothetical protein VGN35_12820 [Jatrophihabitantaceae bacterium]|nr:hypothetical protein [Jatrophihabitantaceae bacterium]
MKLVSSLRVIVVAIAACTVAALLSVPGSAQAAAPQVLRVGTWNGIPGNEPTIDAAMAALHKGGWVLIGPGDYHPAMDYSAAQISSKFPAAVLVTATNGHVRGMDRNGVIIDGTKAGSTPCSSDPSAQDFGPLDSSGNHRGRSGIETRVNGVNIENLTVCNFLSGSADSGNGIWWNGGDDGGTIGLSSWEGRDLTATSTYFGGNDTAASYGLFVSNARGPGSMTDTYASNFSDSGYYIGACPDCNAVINRGHSEYNALGYSGTNSGGHLLIENSEWDNNKTGFVSNSQNSADPPSPQNGACPGNGTGPTGTHSCWVFINNYVHDNNNPNVPAIGDAAIGPVGGGLLLAGDRNNIVVNNRFVNNGSWAVLTTLFPDTGGANPNNISNCHGGVLGGTLLGQPVPCLFDDWGNQVSNNTFSNNGGFGNVTNGDIADLTIPPLEKPGAPGNCFSGNTEVGGGAATTWPLLLQTLQARCGNPLGYPDPVSTTVLLAQVACATQAFFSCPPNVVANYPRTTHVVMAPLASQTTMANPCAGVPANPWCPGTPSAPAATVQTHELPAARIPAAVRMLTK